MSSEVEHPVGVLVALDEVLDALEVTVGEPDGRVEELEVCVGVPEATDTEAEVVEDEPEFSAAATLASVDFECTLITFFAMSAPTIAPTIARIAKTPAIQNPVSSQKIRDTWREVTICEVQRAKHFGTDLYTRLAPKLPTLKFSAVGKEHHN